MGAQSGDGMQQQLTGAQEAGMLFGEPAQEAAGEEQQMQQPLEQHGAPWPLAAAGSAIDMEA